MIQFAKLSLLVSALCSLSFASDNESSCNFKNTAFKTDEVISMKVYYSTLGMYIGAGEATFTTSLERFNGKPVYHLLAKEKLTPPLIIFLK